MFLFNLSPNALVVCFHFIAFMVSMPSQSFPLYILLHFSTFLHSFVFFFFFIAAISGVHWAKTQLVVAYMVNSLLISLTKKPGNRWSGAGVTSQGCSQEWRPSLPMLPSLGYGFYHLALPRYSSGKMGEGLRAKEALPAKFLCRNFSLRSIQ